MTSWEEMPVRYVGEDQLDDLGAAVLGTGGGGNPYCATSREFP